MAVYNGTDNVDILVGTEENDTMNGNGGLDTLIGGLGDDTYFINYYEPGGYLDEIYEYENEGTDTVYSKLNYTLGSNLENLILVGSSAVKGTGNELDNKINGNSYANIIDGGTGADTMSGGDGGDTYYVDNMGDVVYESDDPYTNCDTINASISYVLSENVQNLCLIGNEDINAVGNELNNGIWGNTANNVLDGGTGADFMVGGTGNDNYIIDNKSDTAHEYAGEGTDTVTTTLDYTLSSNSNIENLTLSGTTAVYGTGNELANYITGNSINNILTGNLGNDTINGGTGIDTLYGGTGNDTYIVENVSDVVIEYSGEGTDTVNASYTYTLGNNLENLTLTGSNAINGTGNSSANIITGNITNNTITGNTGNDTLKGGEGNDIYYFNKGDGIDHIIETSGQDIIKYASTVSFTDLYYLKNTNNLIIRNKTNTDRIIIDNYFAGASYKVEQFLFSNSVYVDINPYDNSVSKSLNANTTLTLDVLTEVGNQLTISNVTSPIKGSISVDSNNNIIYTPTTNYSGSDSFSYTLSDGEGGTLTKTVNLTIISVNNNPTANLNSGIVNEDNTLILDVLANASDIDGDSLSIASYTQSAHGNITLNASNMLVYTPTSNYYGSDSFDYTISDGKGGTVTQTVNLTINSVNDVPTATLVSGTVNEDNSLILDVLANASDVDGDSLSIASFTQTSHGTISKNSDNKLVYTPTANYNGTDSFNYTISDGNGSTVTKTVNLTINSANDYPTASMTSGTVNEDNSLIMDVLANASDLDGDSLSVSSFTQTSHGTIIKNTENKLVYTPTANYNGIDSFNYTISDGKGGTVTKTVSLTINSVNDTPTATLVSGNVNEDNSLILDVLANSSDVDGDSLSIASYTQTSHGTVSKNSDNKLVYTPTANYNGTDSFNYTINDGKGGTINKTVSLTINSVNDVPTATLVSGTVNEDNSLILDVLANSSDADGDSLSITSYTQTSHGTISKNSDNKLVYTPTANYYGTDNFNYTISDSKGGTVTKTVNLTINSVNDAPIASLASGSVNKNEKLILDVLANASDVDGDSLSIASYTQTSHGTISKNSDNKLVYTPTANYYGTDSFNYTISDGKGGTVTKTVNLSVIDANHVPTASLTSGTVYEDNSLILDVLASASDADGDGLSIASFTPTSHGTVTKNSDNKLVYTPAANYYGSDSFNYTISDGKGGTVTQTVNLTINSVNDIPNATLVSGTVNEDNSIILDILANASDADGDSLSISSFTQTSHGTISKNSENKLIFTPTANYNGTDSFNYTISDGKGGATTKTVNLTINSVNDAPTASLTSGAVNEDNSLILDVLANASDADGDSLSIASYTQTSHGTISKNSDNKLVYTPTTNYYGTDSFNYTISDGKGGTVTKTVSLTINSVNDAPTATLESGTIKKNATLILDILANASDVDGDSLSIASYTQTAHGSISKNSDNKLVYTPTSNYVGTDNFNYTISDGKGSTVTKTVTISVIDTNHTPTASLVSGTVNEDSSLVLDVLANAYDEDGDSLSIASFTQTSHGTTSKNSDNKLVYTPTANYYGTDSFNYTITDGNGGTVTKTVSLTINSVNDAPTKNINISDQIYEINKVSNFTIAANTFSDVDGNTLTYSACLEDGSELPSWITFDTNNRVFQINGYNSSYETLNIKVIASDGSLATNDIFTLSPKKIAGDSLNNKLTGTCNSDLIFGYAGNDTIDGSGSADVLIGGTGNDLYIVNTTGDLTIENIDEGTDTVNSSVTYTLGSNIENLTLTGTAAISGTGNTLNNYITGNTANNILTGGAGNDTLNGGTGNDTMKGGLGDDSYFINVTADVITEYSGEGTDTVNSGISYTLGSNIENLTLTGTSAISGTGNTLNNYITGNAANNKLAGGTGNDTLNGGLGNDTMRGGAGDDTYYVNIATDSITEYSNEGTDTVNSSVTYTLGSNIENLTLTGTSAISGTGNTLNNFITGNTANNTLKGSSGNDTYLFSLGGKSDTILDTSGTSDKIHFNSDVSKSNIAVFMDSSKNLFVDYGTTKSTDVVKVQTQSSYTIEKIELNNGQYLTNAEINTLIQNMTAYAKSHSISMTSVADVKNNQNLMNLVTAAWHS